MWAAIFGFFVFGAIGWYMAMVVFVIWSFFIVEKESFGWGIFELILCLLFLQFLGKMNIFGSIFDNHLLVIGEIIGYFVIGFIWSFIKWWLYVKDKAEILKKEKDKFFKEHAKESEDRRNEGWIQSIKFGGKRPKATEHKGGIAIWVIYWPFSFVWALLNDLLKRTVRHIVGYLSKWYQGIADRAFQGIDDES